MERSPRTRFTIGGRGKGPIAVDPEGERMNRYFRRLQRFGKSFSARRTQSEMTNKQSEVFDANTPQDVSSARAKNQGKGKVTADKWNQ